MVPSRPGHRYPRITHLSTAVLSMIMVLVLAASAAMASLNPAGAQETAPSNPTAAGEAQAQPVVNTAPTDKIVLSLVATPSNRVSEELSYPSGESFSVTAKLDLSGSETILKNARLSFVAPRHDFFGFAYGAGKPAEATGGRCQDNYTQAITDFRTYRLTADFQWSCEWNTLGGGTDISAEFPMAFLNRVTPDGTTAPMSLSFEYLDAQGQPQRQHTTLTVTARSDKYARVSIRHENAHSRQTAPRSGETGIWLSPARSDETQPMRTPAEGVLTHHRIAAYAVSRYEEHWQLYGKLGFDTVTLKVKLPAEAEYAGGRYSLDPEYPFDSRVWAYDEASHSVTYTGPPIRTPLNRGCQYGIPCYPYLSLLWKNTPIWESGQPPQSAARKFYPLVASVVLDPGTAGEVVVTEEDTAYVGFQPPAEPAPVGVSPASKIAVHAPRESGTKVYHHRSINGIAAADAELRWAVDAYNYNNYSSIGRLAPGTAAREGRLDILTEVKDHGLGPQHYFYRVSFDQADLFPRVLKSLPRGAGEHNFTFNTDPTALAAKFEAAQPFLVGISGTGEQAQETVLHNPVTVGSDVIIDDSAQRFDAIALRFAQPLRLDNELIRLSVSTRLTAKELELWQDPTFAQKYSADTPRTYPNASQVSLRSPDGKSRTVPGTASHSVGTRAFPLSMRVTDASRRTYRQCPEITELNRFQCERVAQLHAVIQTPEAIWNQYGEEQFRLNVAAVLPPGVNPVPPGAFFTPGSAAIPGGEIVENFQDTGATAVVFRDLPVVSRGPREQAIAVRVWVELSRFADPTINVVQWYAYWDDPAVYGVPKTLPVNLADRAAKVHRDSTDLDGDGRTDERFLSATSDLFIRFAGESYAATYVGSGHERLPDKFGTEGLDVGSELSYRMRFINTNPDNAVTNLSFLFMLPYPGRDRAVVENGSGEYPPRFWQLRGEDGVTVQEHSAFATPLTGPVEDVPDNKKSQRGRKPAAELFEFSYLTRQAYDTAVREEYSTAQLLAAQWVPAVQVSNWAEVVAVRATLRGDQSIPEQSADAGKAFLNSIDIVTRNYIPVNDQTRALVHGSQAVASVSVSTDNEHSYLEANSVRPEVSVYEVTGIVFHDSDGNGHFDKDRENVLAGYPVRLFDGEACQPPQDGTALGQECYARDPKQPVGSDMPGGQVVAQQHSDAAGAYRIPVFRRGNYFVGFELPTGGFYYTPVGTDPQLGPENHVQFAAPRPQQGPGSAGYTGSFTLGPENRAAVRNAGVDGAPVFPGLPDTGGPGVAGFALVGLTLAAIAGGAMLRRVRADHA